ncbi:hypothetical protein W911_11320 [Hyphomicrobium nitrativorans NL23]|uniref:Uncharacterized protein n=2 Tax=Hyphomicrobium TaxID=81 RepID=V5SI46_9HYPH|nr:hypothetical protein W911_11320 [Hyphomicrobium nitrativorans NL23]
MAWLLGGIVALVVAYILATQWGWLPRAQVVATGTIQTGDGTVLNTRKYLRASRKAPHKTPGPGKLLEEEVWEVELPNGRWAECEGDDCLAAYEKAWGPN